EKFKNSRLVRKYQFLFENRDTTKVEGKSLLPIYLEEKVSDVYYRKEPEKRKEIIRGEKKVSFEDYIDNQGMRAQLNHIYQEDRKNSRTAAWRASTSSCSRTGTPPRWKANPCCPSTWKKKYRTYITGKSRRKERRLSGEKRR